MPVEDIFENDDWEDQADKLYEWTQNLSLDELGDTSPWKPSLTILQQNSLIINKSASGSTCTC